MSFVGPRKGWFIQTRGKHLLGKKKTRIDKLGQLDTLTRVSHMRQILAAFLRRSFVDTPPGHTHL